jgi:hypothetical protein
MAAKITEEFDGLYADQLKNLLAISRDEIDAITPDGTDLETYAQLIEVVKDASRRNLAQAELKERVVSLGELAVKISKKVAGLAAIFA